MYLPKTTQGSKCKCFFLRIVCSSRSRWICQSWSGFRDALPDVPGLKPICYNYSKVLMLISQRLTWQLWLFQALHLKSFQLSFISVFFFHFLFNLPNLFWCCFLFALEMAWIYHEIHLCHFFMFDKNVMVSLQALQVWSGCNHLLFY